MIVIGSDLSEFTPIRMRLVFDQSQDDYEDCTVNQ